MADGGVAPGEAEQVAGLRWWPAGYGAAGLEDGMHRIEPGLGLAEARHRDAAAAQNDDHGPGAVGVADGAAGLADEGLDLGAAVEANLADADQPQGLDYNAGAEPGTAVRARLTMRSTR